MARGFLLSAGLHALALASVLPLPLPTPPEPGEPPRIEVVFDAGSATPPVPDRPLAAASVQPRPPAPAAGDPLLAAAPAPAPPAPARPADPDAGLQFERRDAQIIPARGTAGNRSPEYPEEAARLHQTGTVLLRLYIGADGAVTRVQTLRSSGVAALDTAATTALARWRFLPAERDGQPVVWYWDQPVSFGPHSKAGL